ASPACFAALLGDERNGRWRIAPASPEARVERRYRRDTLVLETEFTTAEGTVAVVDFMPSTSGDSDVVRIVEGRRGCVPMRMDLALRFDYGASVPWMSRLDDGRLRAIAGPDMVVLSSPVDTRGEDLTTVAEFSVREGERLPFVLMHAASHLEPPRAIDAESALDETEPFWRGWSSRCLAAGRWR